MSETYERGFIGVFISAQVYLDKRLTRLDKDILTEINCLQDKERGGCYASNKYLADFCQCNETTVSKSISKLKQLNYIIDISTDCTQRILRTTALVYGFSQESSGSKPMNDYKQDALSSTDENNYTDNPKPLGKIPNHPWENPKPPLGKSQPSNILCNIIYNTSSYTLSLIHI